MLKAAPVISGHWCKNPINATACDFEV